LSPWRSKCPKQLTAYEKWLRVVHWQLFCTFTFAYQVSERQAQGIFTEFVARAEKYLRAPLVFVRGEEFRYSGCGKPGSPRHYHVLMTSSRALDGAWISALWEQMAGTRIQGAGADIRPFDPSKSGIAYVLKLMGENNGDWSFANLDLVTALSAPATSARMRRRRRRHGISQSPSPTHGLK
jgi:hypothetical protein